MAWMFPPESLAVTTSSSGQGVAARRQEWYRPAENSFGSPSRRGQLSRPAYGFTDPVKRLGEMFQPGPEAYAQDLVPQAYAQHRSAGGQAVQKAEGCLVAFVLHRSGPGGQDEFFSRLNRLFQFRRKVGDHARNGHSRHSDEFREIPGKGIPVVDDPDVRLTHGAHMIE